MASPRICSIDGCDNPVLNEPRGWCSKHYQRWRRTGDPNKSRIDREQTGKLCKFEGCASPSGFKGYCAFHGDRIRRTGDPSAASLSENYKSNINWLISNIDHDGDECLIWPFYRNDTGRGVARLNGRGMTAPRAMCILAHGEPPSSHLQARHSCGKGHEGCVNPKHLSWGEPKENEFDKIAHGTVRRGAKINTNKLNENQVREILFLSDMSGVALANKFSVSPALISSIRKRKIWAWLKI